MAFHKRPLEQEGVVHTFSTFPFTKEVVANLWMLTLQIWSKLQYIGGFQVFPTETRCWSFNIAGGEHMFRPVPRIPHVLSADFAFDTTPHYPIFPVVAEAFDHEVSNLSLAAVESGEVGGRWWQSYVSVMLKCGFYCSYGGQSAERFWG